MPMGYGANYGYVIAQEKIPLVSNDIAAALSDLLETLEVYDLEIEDLARAEDWQDWDSIADHIYSHPKSSHSDGVTDVAISDIQGALKSLYGAFEKDTGGLKLWLCMHDCNEHGSCYDDVDGAFWVVEGMVELTEAGKKLRERVPVVENFWVTYG